MRKIPLSLKTAKDAKWHKVFFEGLSIVAETLIIWLNE